MQRIVGAGLHRAGCDPQGMRGLCNRAAAKVALPQHVPMLLRQPAERGGHQMAVHDMLAGVAGWLVERRRGRQCREGGASATGEDVSTLTAPLTAAVRVLRIHGPTPLGTRPC